MKYYFLLIMIFLLAPELSLADDPDLEYLNPMVNIPGYTPGEGIQSYINLIYGISISVAALLAVIKIVIAGVKWMLSDVVTDKMDAKKDIQGALFGLIIIISAVLIITIINPAIVGG